MTEIKNMKMTFCVVSIFLILILISFLTVANIITVIKLQIETRNILNQALELNKTSNYQGPKTNQSTYNLEDSSDKNQNQNNSISEVIKRVFDWSILKKNIESESLSPVDANSSSQKVDEIYFNAASDLFFSRYYIDWSKTDMFFDELGTALTFEPIIKLKESSCKEAACEEKVNNPFDFVNNELYYNNQKISLPSEIKNKNVINWSASKLSNKWIIGLVVSFGDQETGYVYLFDGVRLETLINPDTERKMITRYGRGGGSISAGGEDNQFLIIYSGYEIFAYLYNNGEWQDLSSFFNLRLSNSGFPAKIIRSDAGNSANWYVCSNDLSKPKLIKLWQNNTNKIQGLIDISNFLKPGPAICSLKNNRELNIVRGNQEAYIIEDLGFDNSHSYLYQSNNFNSYAGKNTLSANLSLYSINALEGSYSLSLSNDFVSWQVYKGEVINFNNPAYNYLFVKAYFKNKDNNYSQWFGGLDLISYTAK